MTLSPFHDLARQVLDQSVKDFEGLKQLGDRAIGQLPAQGFQWRPEPESNSIGIIIRHMSGNMISRWTDFLTSDGEKPYRNRDTEFEGFGEEDGAPASILARWEQGWAVLLDTLRSLTPDDVLRTVTIRSEPHTVLQAIHRQIAHYGYHVGQIVYAAKAFQSSNWQSLSIPKGGSEAFNRQRSEERR